MSNLPVIDLDATGGGSGGSSYLGTFTNYNDLVASHPTANFGDFAVVENDQGTQWLPWTVGGTYYPQGTYYWNNTEWTSNVADIAEELQNLKDGEFKVKVDAVDTLGEYLFDKMDDTSDVVKFLSVDISGVRSIGYNITAKNKPFTPSPARDPLPSDDNTSPNVHRVGQVALNTSTGKLFISTSIATGAAVWKPIAIIDVDTIKTKSGIVLNAALTGNPKTATVTFATPFNDTNYSVSLVCNTVSGTAYTPVIENILAGSFDINMTVNNINNLTDVRWIAVKNGEN